MPVSQERQRRSDGEANHEAARRYLSLGWPVLAECPPDHAGMSERHCAHCQSPGKRPWHCWAHYQPDAHGCLPTAKEVDGWWQQHPTSNVGLALGAVCRIDIEGPQARQRLGELSKGDLPATLEFNSGRTDGTGEGWLYTLPPGERWRTYSGGLPLGGELRLQALGAQTVLPPSRHHSGRQYAWKSGRSPTDLAIAPAPAWLLEALRDQKRTRERPPRPPQGGNGSAAYLAQIRRIKEALARLATWRAEGYDSWLLVGMALHSFGEGDELLDLWDEWSKRCPSKYEDGACECKWATFSAERGIKLGSLFHWAKKDNPPPPKGNDGGNGNSSTGAGESRPAAPPVSALEATPDDGVVVLGTDEHRVTAEAEAILVANVRDVYQRGRQLVQVLSHKPEDTEKKPRIQRPDDAPLVRSLPSPILREQLSRHVRFINRTKDGDKPAHVPGYAVTTIAARGHWPGLPRLGGVVSHPVLLPDGAILASPGYHADSELLLCLPPGLTLSIPEAPTPRDVRWAKFQLLDVVRDFPFKTEAHRSAWLAALLTPLARYAFEGPAPLFFADGNVAGCGKGLLLDTNFLIVSGRRASVMSYTNDKTELKKAITTIAVEGDEMVLFDNVDGAFGNATLDRALTATQWQDRILGSTAEYDGPLMVTWYATGNNLYVVGDTARRLLPLRLESPLERPEERTGLKYPDLRAHVRARRGELLSHALTILRAYCLAGRPQPKQLAPWGSFEGWSDLIRGAVTWLMEPDPADAREDMRAASCPETEALQCLYEGIAEADPTHQGVTVAELLERAVFRMGNPKMQALIEALQLLCPNRARTGGLDLDSKSIGMKLHHLKDRTVAGLRLERVGGKERPRWRVVAAGPGGAAHAD
jgi:hypothetical protein